MPRVLSLALIAFLSGCGPSEPDQPATPAASDSAATAPRWEVSEGIETPESVYVEPGTGTIFVSLIAGQPGDKDGNGRIAKLNPDGSVVSTSWATGLNAPKGLRSHEGTLWTADIDEIVGINIASGQITSRVKVDGAQFLNDVATAPDGTVYVSDMMATKIYALKDGRVSVFAEGEDLEYPNGLVVDNGRLVVGAWGKPEPDFSTKVPGHLFALDLNSKQKTLLSPNPVGNIDGVESDGKGGYVVTDWNAGKVLQVTSTGEVRPVREFSQGTADHAFVPAQNLLLVPHMPENKVAAYDLTGALQ
jgi:sugar lactone lactonase YvrE